MATVFFTHMTVMPLRFPVTDCRKQRKSRQKSLIVTNHCQAKPENLKPTYQFHVNVMGKMQPGKCKERPALQYFLKEEVGVFCLFLPKHLQKEFWFVLASQFRPEMQKVLSAVSTLVLLFCPCCANFWCLFLAPAVLMFRQSAQLCLVLGKQHSCAKFLVFWRKIVFYGVLTRILFPMGLRVFCAIFFGARSALVLIFTLFACLVPPWQQKVFNKQMSSPPQAQFLGQNLSTKTDLTKRPQSSFYT